MDYREINSLLKEIRQRGGKIYFREFNKEIDMSLKNNCFIEDNMRFFYVTTKYKGLIATYIFDKLTGKKEEAESKCSTGMKGWMAMRRFLGKREFLIPNIVKESDLVDGKNPWPFATGPILYANEKYNHSEHYAYDYDMNSAYALAMLGDIPDTRPLKTVHITNFNCGIAEDKYICFDGYGNFVENGNFAAFRFERLKSPFVEFATYYYNQKKNAKTKKQRQWAKNILNHSVGYLQRINPFVRAAIVARANETMKALIDENTLYCNTDSIISLKPRLDLKIGKELGNWKLENKGLFRYDGMNYQWAGELPAYRGIPTKWFSKDFNILTDELPICGNMFKFDYINYKIIKLGQ